MKQIQVGLRFPKNSELQSQMKQAIDVLQKSATMDLKLDTKSFTKSLNDMSSTLSNLKNQLKSFGVLDTVINENQVKSSTDAINKQTQALKVQQDIINGSKVMKTSNNQLVNPDGTKSLIKDLTVVEDKYKNIVTVTNTYDATTQKLKSTIVGTTNEIVKQEQVIIRQQQAFTKLQGSMQGKLSIAGNNSLINPAIIGDLQKQLNSINVNTPKSQIDSLNATIKNLASNDSQIVRLQNSISNLTRSMSSTQNKYGSLVNKNDIQNSINEINKLKKALNDVTNGKGMSNTALTQSLNGANNSIKTLTSNAQKASNALKTTQIDAMSVGSAIQSTLGKFGIYASTAMVMRQLFTVMKDGVQYVMSLDEAYFNLSVTMDMSMNQFNKMTNSIQNMSKELGSSAKDVMDIAVVYANASSSIEEIMGKIAPSVALSNVASMDGTEVTKTMQSTLNAFKMLEDGSQTATQATERIGNALVSISANMKYDFQDGINQMVSGIQEAGNIAEMSGVSMEKYASTIGAVVESTGKSGSEVANGYKMISARILQIKELSEEMGISEVEMGKAETALAEFDIAVREGDGDMRNLDSILEDLAVKWKTMNDEEKQYVSEATAGNRQRATMISIMESMDKSQQLYNISMESSGELMRANDKYVESFAGKLGTLSATFQSLMSNNLNGDFMKGAIDGLSGFLNILDKSTQAFGTFPIIITGVVGALVLFNTKFKQTTQLMAGFNPILNKVFSGMNKMTATLKTNSVAMNNEMKVLKAKNLAYQQLGFSTTAIGVKMSALATKIATNTALTVGLTVATTALNMVLSMGMMFGVTALIGGLFKLGDAMITTKKEAKEMSDTLNESLTTTSKTVADAETTLSKMKEIESAIANTNNMEEKARLQSELNDLQVQMGQVLPETITGLNNEGVAISSSNGLIQQTINLKKDKIKLDAIEMASNSANIKSQIDNLNELKDTQDKIKLAESKGEKSYSSTRLDKEGYGGPAKEVDIKVRISNESKQKLNDEMLALTEELSRKVNAVDILRGMGETDASISSILGIDVAILDQYVASLNDAIPPQVEVANGIDGIGGSAEETANRMKGLTDSFSGLSGDISLLEEVLANFNEHGALSIDLRDKLLTSGDSNLIALLGDENTFLERGNQLLNDKRALEQQTTDEMINLAMADVNAQAEAEITKMNNSNLSTTQRANNEAGAVNNNATNYGIDANNNIIAENDKLNASTNSSNQRVGMEAGVVDTNSKNYSTDSSNYSIFENNKLMGLSGMTQQRASVEASLVGSNLGAYQTDASNYGLALTSKLSQTQSFVNQNNAMMNQLMVGQANGVSQKNPKNPYISTMKAPQGNTGVGYYGVQGSVGGSGYNPVQTYKPTSGGSGGKGGSKGGGSSAKQNSLNKEANKEKEIPLIEDLSDRYYTLNNNLNDYNVLLETNKSLQSLATGKELQKLLAEEINLLEKKKQATKALMEEEQKARDEVKNSNIMKEFGYDVDGDITNFNQIMNQKRAHANKLSNAERETYSKYIDDLQEAVKKYEELNESVESHKESLLELDATIKDSAMDMLNDVRNKVYDALKKKYDDLRDSELATLDKEIEMKNKELERLRNGGQDDEGQLQALKKELEQWKNNDSAYSVQKQAELEQQIKEKQLEMDINRLEEEKDKTSEKYDAMTEEKALWEETNLLITSKNQEEMFKLLTGYSENYSDIGHLLGANFSDAFTEEIKNAINAFDLLYNKVNNFNPTPPTPPTPAPKPPNTSTGGGSTPKPVGKGSKVKVVDPNSDIYEDSYTSRSSGSWKGAGVSSSDQLYVVNDNNGSVALSRTNSINGAIGWIKKNKVQSFAVGTEYLKGDQLAQVHKGEAIVPAKSNPFKNPEWNKAMVELPKLTSMMTMFNGIKTPDYTKMLEGKGGNSSKVEFNNEYHITNNTPFEAKQMEVSLEKKMKKDLIKSGIRW